MFQLSEKALGETFCEQAENKDLSTLLAYLRWTFSGPNVDIFKEWISLPSFYRDWFDFGDRKNLRTVYRSLLRANSCLAESCEWRLKKLCGSAACSETELTVYYSGIAESNIECAGERSDSQPMVWLAQQCITLCDHLVRQTYLLKETKAAIEEAELSDWLKEQSETEWEPVASSFNNVLSQEAHPSFESLTTESQASEECTDEECSDCPFEPERRAGLVDCPGVPSRCSCDETAVSGADPSETQAQESVRPVESSEKPAKDLNTLCSVLAIAFGLSAGFNLALIEDRVNPPEVEAHEKQELVSYANSLLVDGRAVRP
ncbi:hypothetical protein C1752_10437 [Acaryochloris thomasi RCC1774]|uniref:Uncharacterized protein n=1 Tax=Acaryochloris thomasi RCC1774 TaxID=1764569 RepID=A0A2W1JNW1_9CYAN|nr:hypothetical protein [Acaryochloris thomasi]PZD70587.1 hypothetical protein C1752_10437 [Acaryochloris thomasi RCC1774]